MQNLTFSSERGPDEIALVEIATDTLNGLQETISVPIVEAINKLTEQSKQPAPVFYVETPKELTPLDCPVEGKDGFWEPQKEYAERKGLESSTLTAYRKVKEGARWSSCGNWGDSMKGEHIFKKVEPNKSNSKFLYWVCDK